MQTKVGQCQLLLHGTRMSRRIGDDIIAENTLRAGCRRRAAGQLHADGGQVLERGGCPVLPQLAGGPPPHLRDHLLESLEAGQEERQQEVAQVGRARVGRQCDCRLQRRARGRESCEHGAVREGRPGIDNACALLWMGMQACRSSSNH